MRIDNDPFALAAEIAKAGREPGGGAGGHLRLVLGRRRARRAPAPQVHLAHPLGVKGFAYRRVKNDERDAADLADLLRMGRLPEAWIAPPAVRELRELVRHRAKLVALRSGLKAAGARGAGQAGRARPGVGPVRRRRPGPAGSTRRAGRRRTGPGWTRCCRLIDAFDFEIDAVARQLRGPAGQRTAGYQAIQAIPGVGPVLAAVFVAEIGDVDRFPGAGAAVLAGPG